MADKQKKEWMLQVGWTKTYLRVWGGVAERREARGLSGLCRGSGEETALACCAKRKTGLVFPFSMQSQVFDMFRHPVCPILGFIALTIFLPFFKLVENASFAVWSIPLEWKFLLECLGTSLGPGTRKTDSLEIFLSELMLLLFLETCRTPLWEKSSCSTLRRFSCSR